MTSLYLSDHNHHHCMLHQPWLTITACLIIYADNVWWIKQSKLFHIGLAMYSIKPHHQCIILQHHSIITSLLLSIVAQRCTEWTNHDRHWSFTRCHMGSKYYEYICQLLTRSSASCAFLFHIIQYIYEQSPWYKGRTFCIFVRYDKGR